MKGFVEIREAWNQIKKDMNIDSILQEKFVLLVQDKSKEGVSSCTNMLLSFGDEAICEVLQEKEGQILLRDDLNFEHPYLWFEEIMMHCEESPIWNALVEKGAFGTMSNLLFRHLKKEDLSERVEQQQFMWGELQRMHLIPKGMFMMGALPDDKAYLTLETPRHTVIMNTGFRMGKYPVTEKLYADVMGNREETTSPFTPINKVSWWDAIIFCNRLSAREDLEPVYSIPPSVHKAYAEQKGDRCYELDAQSNQVEWKREADGYRLPTEAEWEYAARGGEQYLYAGSDGPNDVAWYTNNCSWRRKTVGEKNGNGFGLYDMSGHVWEWIWDSAFRQYTSTAQCDPIYTDESTGYRVVRGGCWTRNAESTRLSNRSSFMSSTRELSVGFRIARGH